MSKLIQRSFLNAFGTGAYIAMVAWVMFHGEKVFEKMPELIGPIAFLMLFVLSAAVTGSLVLGKPLLMYLDDQKKEAVQAVRLHAVLAGCGGHRLVCSELLAVMRQFAPASFIVFLSEPVYK